MRNLVVCLAFMLAASTGSAAGNLGGPWPGTGMFFLLNSDSCTATGQAAGNACTIAAIDNANATFKLAGTCQSNTSGQLACATCTTAGAACTITATDSNNTTWTQAGSTCQTGTAGVLYCASCPSGSTEGATCQSTTTDSANNTVTTSGHCSGFNSVFMCDTSIADNSGSSNSLAVSSSNSTPNASTKSGGCNSFGGSPSNWAIFGFLLGGLLLVSSFRKRA